MNDELKKYLKYKKKYLLLKKILKGGDNWRRGITQPRQPQTPQTQQTQTQQTPTPQTSTPQTPTPQTPTPQTNSPMNSPMNSPTNSPTNSPRYIAKRPITQDPSIKLVPCNINEKTPVKYEKEYISKFNSIIGKIYNELGSGYLHNYNYIKKNWNWKYEKINSLNTIDKIIDKIINLHLLNELGISNNGKLFSNIFSSEILEELNNKLIFYKDAIKKILQQINSYNSNKFIIVDGLNIKMALKPNSYITDYEYDKMLDMFYIYLQNKYPDHKIIIIYDNGDRQDIRNRKVPFSTNYEISLHNIEKGKCSIPSNNYLSITKNGILNKLSNINYPSRIIIYISNLLYPSKYDKWKQKSELDDITLLLISEFILLTRVNPEILILSGDNYRWANNTQ
jgi:hypothetical protein